MFDVECFCISRFMFVKQVHFIDESVKAGKNEHDGLWAYVIAIKNIVHLGYHDDAAFSGNVTEHVVS